MRAAARAVCRCTLGVYLLCLLPASARAASRTLKAGQILGVAEDLVLSGDDVLEVQGTAARPCRIDGNGQQIRTRGDWRGRVKITYCEFRGLGSARKPALDLTAAGDGDLSSANDGSPRAARASEGCGASGTRRASDARR